MLEITGRTFSSSNIAPRKKPLSRQSSKANRVQEVQEQQPRVVPNEQQQQSKPVPQEQSFVEDDGPDPEEMTKDLKTCSNSLDNLGETISNLSRKVTWGNHVRCNSKK